MVLFYIYTLISKSPGFWIIFPKQVLILDHLLTCVVSEYIALATAIPTSGVFHP